MSLMPRTVAAAKEPAIEPTERHHNQHVDEKSEGKGVIETDNLHRERPSQSGQAASQRESNGKDALNIDAEPTRHALVVDGGAHLRTEPGKFKPRDKSDGHDKRQADEEQPINAEALAHERDAAAQIGRQPYGLLNRPEKVGRCRHRDKDDADGEQALIELARSIKPAIERAFEHDAHNGGRKERKRQRREKRPTQTICKRNDDITAQHGEAAVGQVDEIHQAECDRQSDRQEKEQHPIRKTVEQNAQGRGDHGPSRMRVPVLVPLTCRDPKAATARPSEMPGPSARHRRRSYRHRADR